MDDSPPIEEPLPETAALASRRLKRMLGGGASALVGVALYCVCLAQAGPSVPVGRAIEAAGPLGALAIALLVLGSGFWMAACVGSLHEMHAPTAREADERPR